MERARVRPDRPDRPDRLVRPPLPVLVTVLLAIAACSGEGSAGYDAVEQRSGIPEVTAPPPPPAPSVPVPGRFAAAGGRPPQAANDAALAPLLVIRTGTASLEVDSLEPALAGARRMAERVGGYVADTRISAGDDRRRSAQMSLRIPAERFEGVLQGLGGLGEVEEVEVRAQDVSEEFVDLSARVANARRTEERLLELLDGRTGSLEDVLAVERELARVREEVERVEGRLRYLRSRAAVSTLDLTFQEDEPWIGRGHPVGSVLSDAVRGAWENFVATLAALVALLGYMVPLAALALLGAWAYRRWRRAFRRG